MHNQAHIAVKAGFGFKLKRCDFIAFRVSRHIKIEGGQQAGEESNPGHAFDDPVCTRVVFQPKRLVLRCFPALHFFAAFFSQYFLISSLASSQRADISRTLSVKI